MMCEFPWNGMDDHNHGCPVVIERFAMENRTVLIDKSSFLSYINGIVCISQKNQVYPK